MTEQQYQTNAERVMARARARVELENITDDAVAGDLISLQGLKRQFAIKHVMILTFVVAAVVSINKAVGPPAATMTFMILMFVWLYVWVQDRQHKHSKRIAGRIREFKKRHKDVDLDGMDVNTIWKLKNRDDI